MSYLYFVGIVFALMLVMTALPWAFALLEALFRTTIGIMVLCLIGIMAISMLSHVM